MHFGPLPLETLKRQPGAPDLSSAVPREPLIYRDADNSSSLVNSMGVYAAHIDAARNGPVSEQQPQIPDEPEARARALKSLAYFHDAKHAACGVLLPEHRLEQAIRNPDLPDAHAALQAMPPEEPGFHHMIGQGLIDGIEQNTSGIEEHTYAMVVVCDHYRDTREDEPGHVWLRDAGRHRASIRAAEVAVILAGFIRSIGYAARAHTESTTDVNLAALALSMGAAERSATGQVSHPYLGQRFGLAAVTMTLTVACDEALAPRGFVDRFRSHGPNWWLGGGPGLGGGMGTVFRAGSVDPYRSRDFAIDAYGMSSLKRRDTTSTLIDADRIPRSPKRADGFWRANYGDMGKVAQENCVDEFCVVKTPYGEAQYALIGALHLLSKRPTAGAPVAGNDEPVSNAARIKSALHFLGADMVGISAAPEWAWYSHELDGSEIVPEHDNAITLLIDQGHETMEGAAGDDWIAVSQSMRAYLRGMFLAGVVAEQIRRLGYKASVHSVVDSDILHTPLVILSGLGETSRIGDVALNPFLGPRLKTSVITTDMPLAHDRPVDFGLQAFCGACNKCARECPSGAISAGPKVMFNGYETWKADIEKCTRYRVTQDKGAMCGRCMKTCPWNLEGLFVEKPFRWLAMHFPKAAPWLARLDDRLGHGSINARKKWWWDLETTMEGVKQAVPPERISVRQIDPDLDITPEGQTLACYPSHLMPPPVPVVFPMDREAGIKAYRDLLSPDEYRQRLAEGALDEIVPRFVPVDIEPVQNLRIVRRELMVDSVVRLVLEHPDGEELAPFEAGAHIDLVIDAPFTRQYSLAGDPADRHRYELGVLLEPEGRGGSIRVHERLFEGQIVPVTGPSNHFPLEESATKTLLFGGGIGITPMLAMAHRLHALGADFELHYCMRSRTTAGFLDDLDRVPWSDRVRLHVSEEGTRADLNALIGEPDAGTFLYTCGPSAFMEAVLATGEAKGWREEQLRKEYFSVPEQEDYLNEEFEVKLQRSGETVVVAADVSLAKALQARGHKVVTKCEDGLCGTCQLQFISGDVEHRDFILSSDERQSRIITCCSRAAPAGEPLVLDL
ncbi:MAG: reductive dehalogenase domain-containing protein [Pseudomonadota bacterium]